jgi:hypothetical protein
VRAADDVAAAREQFVYVEEDGSARDLAPDEAEYLATDFQFGDGNRPYIKGHYEARNGWGQLKGLLERRNLPAHVVVRPYDPASVAVESRQTKRDRALKEMGLGALTAGKGLIINDVGIHDEAELDSAIERLRDDERE